ncbi:MAG: hypothetical protein LBD88_05490 [Candidatus Peribacteria bacterium]|jgi:hypothetical protein|nr:hypothetical protein [Candidatus Peribacteria bacterium]
MPANAGEVVQARPYRRIPKPISPVPMTNLGYGVISGEVEGSNHTDVKFEAAPIPSPIISSYNFLME